MDDGSMSDYVHVESIEALPDTQLAMLHRDDFFKIIKKRYEEDYLKMADFIKSVPVFN